MIQITIFCRVAYVIELEHVDGLPEVDSVVEVDLDILGGRRQVTHKDFWLVLKSPSQVTWKIHTRKLQGYADIVVSWQILPRILSWIPVFWLVKNFTKNTKNNKLQKKREQR